MGSEMCIRDRIITLQYDTTVDQLKKIRDEIESHINSSEDYNTSIGVAVRVDKFSDSSIDMYVRCFTKTGSWNNWLDVKERLAIAIKEIVEKNKERAEFLANQLNDAIVINGDGLDEEVLTEANLGEAETVLALTNDDEDNLMVSVLVEKFAKDQKDIDDKRTMALINKPNYSLLQSSLKIDDLIDPRMTTVSSILKHIHKGTIENAYTLSDGEYEVIEAEIIETSELINKEIKNSNLPDELRIGAVLRDKKIIIPRSNFVFKKDDRVVFIVKKDSISFVENIFRLSSV